jgi:antitoxin (DNA-binding transcriptional repressor) of toxin-antitoxin stability system
MAVVHISEAEVAGDVPGLVARVLAGEEIVIDSKAGCVKVVPAAAPVGRPLSEIIARLRADTKERGYPLYMDDDFADDMEEIIRNRKPADRSAWD